MTTVEVVATVSFWCCLGGLSYAYFLYPGLAWFFSRCFGRRIDQRPATIAVEALPSISILIVANNEESIIAKRIENALALDYPRERLEIAVASDGSTDRTNELVRQYASAGVRLFDFQVRRGKAAALNSAVPALNGEIILLSDANTFFAPDAGRKLVRWFIDSSVHSVCGRLLLTDPSTGTNVDSLYWRYETFLKRCEGRLGALLGANGAVYAIRKAIYTPIPDNTLVDDFVIPLYAKLRHGGLIVYDCEAVAHEDSPASVAAEFRRRARIGAGGYQSLVLLWRLLSPRYGWTAFAFCSHKLMRWLCPFFMIGSLVSNVALLSRTSYAWFFAAQLVFYAVAAVTAFVPTRFTALKPLRLTTMFASMNIALLVGFFRFATTRQQGTWTRTARLAEVE